VELRHSFVSLLSDADVPLENISGLVGHRATTVTETIYRKQLRQSSMTGYGDGPHLPFGGSARIDYVMASGHP
jgi:hypothetical protein